MIYFDNFHNLGIDIIDKQHLELINNGKYLIKFIENGGEKEEVLTIFDEFIYKVKNHFITEEKLFNSFNYVDSLRHEKIHNLFLEILYEHRKNYVNQNIEISTHIVYFLTEWAENHILTFDLAFANEYKAKKLAI